MPVMALGTAGYDNKTTADAVGLALAAGLNNIHTAYDYYNVEGVAAGLKGRPRQSFFITGMTAPCVHPAGPPIRNVSDPKACTALTTSDIEVLLGELSLPYVDLLLLHGPNAPFNTTTPCDAATCAVNNAQWAAYEAALKSGKTRAIGVSNFCKSCFACLNGTVPAVNQIQLHVGTGADPEGLLSYHAQHGVITQAYAPLAAGGVVSDPLVTEVAGRTANKSTAQVGLRWVVQNRIPTSLVVRADNAQYLAEDIDVFDWEIAEADMSKLDAAVEPKGQQGGRPSWGCCDI
eukprot:TRINITY_DN41910_c0_g1_i2.p1 TRINITY_DN41910_c0_g1~~TRINITY_DN41910_c0_g1_i2.p1  ORF type:complete len:290 (+),score=59.36 TRINITY_DN41910_c0_g1_i2:165-1034(+)